MKKQPNNQIERPPIVCIVGHIDHGKSTLLDYIRKTNVVESEAGGITQRISAYEVLHKTPKGKEEKITFLDTPGHEAFSSMRACGATVADIAVLIVSAEDGVKKQTVEAFKCITDSKIPFVVAINKMDKPGADIEKTKNSLTENGIYLEGYGGNIPYVPVSSKTGEGISDLMDMILLLAEMAELKGDKKKPAEGFVLEVHLDEKKGLTAVLVIKDGTIKKGMYVAAGDAISSTRMMEDFLGNKITEASFSSPIKIIGFDKLPKIGKPFFTFENKKEAEEYMAKKEEKKPKKVSLDAENPEESVMRVVIRAGVAGAINAIEHEINKIKSDKVKIKIINSGVGTITENDVKLASGRNPAVILGFDVDQDSSAKTVAERLDVKIKIFDIIYKLAEWLEEEVKRKTPKMFVEFITAESKVLKVFSNVKDKYIIGARVEKGSVKIGQEVKIMRKSTEIGRGKIRDLEKDRNKISEAREGVEFGCQLQSNVSLAPGDKFEAFEMIEK